MKRHSSILKLAFLTILTFLPSFLGVESIAGSPPVLDPDSQFEYAQKLFFEGDFFNAAGEYKRFVHFFPDDERVERARFNTGLSYFRGRRFTEAVRSFKALIDIYRDSALSIQAYIMISRCRTALHSPGAAAAELRNALALTDDDSVRDEVYYRLGWIYIDMAQWENARLNFRQISLQGRAKYDLDSIARKVDRKDDFITTKQPETAGVLSIVPGAGYLYCGRYKDALIALLANGIIAYAAYEAFDNDLNALGGILTFVGIGFYAGNIIGATAAAHKHNRQQTRRFIDHLKNNVRINLSSGLRHKRVMISLRYDF
jgi:tetratricopeptide (TPR) repeat protein